MMKVKGGRKVMIPEKVRLLMVLIKRTKEVAGLLPVRRATRAFINHNRIIHKP
jgi:hypothetical protein